MSQLQAEVLIIGAGVGGLALATDLHAAGQEVRILDKSRGVSGRASTRRLSLEDGREARLDHGARYFTARQTRTRGWAEAGVAAGWLKVWTRQVPEWRDGEVSSREDGHPRYVGVAGMNALGHELARELAIQTDCTVTRLEREAGGWRVHHAGGDTYTAARLVLNLPAPQLLALLHASGLAGLLPQAEHDALSAVQADPTWAVGAVLRRDLEADWPALRLHGHPLLDWVAREHTKRPAGHPPALMLHATPEWTRAHLEDSREAVQSQVRRALQELVDGLKIGPLDIETGFAHRWRYATPTTRYPQAAGWLPELGLGWCGDWCTPDEGGTRVEAALLSGWALAGKMLG